MSVEIHKFNNKKYLCKSHSGFDNMFSPSVSWSPIEGAESYALIFEDPDALPVPSNFIHWYIPRIPASINKIDEINITKNEKSLNNITKNINSLKKSNEFRNNKMIMGFNSLHEIGYHGPCAPNGSGKHKYILKLYGLRENIFLNSDNLTITSSTDFEERFKPNIISFYKKLYYYQYGDDGLSNNV